MPRLMTAARAAGAAVTYRTYPGEGHGFRRAETLEDCLRSELAFYREVLVGEAED